MDVPIVGFFSSYCATEVYGSLTLPFDPASGFGQDLHLASGRGVPDLKEHAECLSLAMSLAGAHSVFQVWSRQSWIGVINTLNRSHEVVGWV